MTSVRAPATCGLPPRTDRPPLRIASMPGPTRTTSSKTTLTSRGATDKDAPAAGVVRMSVACPQATAGNASAVSATTNTAREALTPAGIAAWVPDSVRERRVRHRFFKAVPDTAFGGVGHQNRAPHRRLEVVSQ